MAFMLSPGDIAFGMELGFLFGIFAASLDWNFYVIFVAAALCAMALAVFKKRLWKECLLFVSALALGSFYFHFYAGWRASHANLPSGRRVSFSAVVSDEPSPSEKFLVLAASLQPPFSGDIKIFARPDSDIRYGDLLSVQDAVRTTDIPGRDPAVFLPKMEVLSGHNGFWLREWMINLKLAILGNFMDILPGDQAALLGGITFGSKQNFKPELKDAMALSGLTHLVAISGYNITIVIFAVGQACGRWFSRRATFFVSLAFLFLFMLMVGGGASGVRAAIMGFLALVARQAGRIFSMRNAIVLTAAVMALFDPTILTRNMSFVLSFLSLLGIVYLGPPIKKLLRQEEKGFLDWKESGVTTLSAQLAVMPVLVNAFGRFSAVAIAANILALGTVPLTMFFGFLLAALGFVSRGLAFFAGGIAGLLLGYQLFVIRFFANLAVPLPISFNSATAMFIYYLFLAAFIFFHT